MAFRHKSCAVPAGTEIASCVPVTDTLESPNGSLKVQTAGSKLESKLSDIRPIDDPPPLDDVDVVNVASTLLEAEAADEAVILDSDVVARKDIEQALYQFYFQQDGYTLDSNLVGIAESQDLKKKE